MNGDTSSRPKRRFSTTEVYAFLLGIVFLLFGVAAVIWPHTGLLYHPTNDVNGSPTPSDPEVLTTTRSRVYGIIAILMGSGMVAGALYHEKSEP
jgi:hypothetical protein